MADDQGFVAQRRIIALFYRGIKGIAIHMGDIQLVQFCMVDKAR
jgi:hypothetical protein